MKRVIFAAMMILCCFFISISAVFASGTGNVNGGGGSLNQGKAGYVWPGVGYDGVRVTVVDAHTGQRISSSIDLTNVNVASLSANICHFGKMSKIDYRNGAALSPQVGNYAYYNPVNPIPQIISGTTQKADINVIKRYFCSEAAAKLVSEKTGIPFADIESGKYKMVIEPVIYIIYQHVYFAMTTTEAGLYNRATGGDFGSHFPTVIMKNFALALFLERDDLGFPAWKGSTTTARKTEEMISVLGIGIISYKEQPPTEITYNREYRVDTDMIVAVELFTTTQKTPKIPAYATFTINGKKYTHNNIYIPANGSQLAWVKWRTPKTPGEVTITIKSNCKLSVNKIVAKVVSLDENQPPDPQANDRNDSFRLPAKPSYTNTTQLTWGEWDCWWHPDWVWHSNGSYWCDHGWYDYAWVSYSASLSASMETIPDQKVPTASKKTMKSGYGFTADISTQISSSAPGSHLTGVQNVVAYFPEFEYKTYWRLLERVNTGYRSTFRFKKNNYSTYGRPVHFTPVYYPDGRYTTYAQCLDAWTPAGMLQIHLTDDITIQDSLFDDWHIRPDQ